jgi:broad specificity phosphatase PhoE
VLRAFFIRHGKAASLLSGSDYDALSPTGAEQSERLGNWLAEEGFAPEDAVFVGPRKRHAETYAVAARACAAHGHPLAPPNVVVELDEHDAVNLMGTLLPVLAAEDAGIRALAMAVARGESPSEADLLLAFKGVAHRWVKGDLPHGDVEPWAAFRARVVRAMAAVAAAGSEEPGAHPRKALVFTSAGVIAAAVGAALELQDEKTVDLTVAPFNASVTELAFAEGGWTLRTFNTTPHLREARLRTRI